MMMMMIMINNIIIGSSISSGSSWRSSRLSGSSVAILRHPTFQGSISLAAVTKAM